MWNIFTSSIVYSLLLGYAFHMLELKTFFSSLGTAIALLLALVGFSILLSQKQPQVAYETIPDTVDVVEEKVLITPAITEEPNKNVQEEVIEEATPAVVVVEPQTQTQEPTEEPPQPTIEPTTTPSLYAFAPLSFDEINDSTRPAIVNILCGSNQGSSIAGATGSGVIIDSRGVILTNAHVAQYLLLQSHKNVKVSCVIRIGAPAKPRYTADVLAFPNAWAAKHAKDIRLELPTGTGEHDWALLYITGRTDGSPKPETFPFIEFDTRQAVTVENDSVLLASYPAGFLGGPTLRKDLWPVSTVVSIQKVFTFTKSKIDILALGGNIAAQGGSSGGGVVNQWGKLVGLISTSSTGDTTAERDLRAVTLSHINESIKQQTGDELLSFLENGSFEETVELFKTNSLPFLLEYYPL